MDNQKVVLLCRSATPEQLTIQRDYLLKISQDNNWEVGAIIMEKRRGTSRRRFKLRLAMRLAQRHNAAILVEDVSRIARDTAIAAGFSKMLKRRAIKLFSAKDGVKADLVASMFQLVNMAILAAFA